MESNTATPLPKCPEDVPTAFARAWNERAPARIAALFDEDAEFVNVTGLWWHDRASIQQAHAYGLRRIFDRSTLSVTKVTVKHLSEHIAVVHARMRLRGQRPVAGAEQPQPRTTIFSFVVHETADGWRCASAHNTDVVPGAETNLIDDEGRLRAVSYRESGPHATE